MLYGAVELAERFSLRLFVVDIRPNLIGTNVVHIQQAAVPDRLVVISDLSPAIQVHMNAHAAKSQIRLRGPGRSRLAITDGGNAENPPDIFEALPLPAFKFVCAFQKSKVLQFHCRRGLNAMPIRVVTNAMFPESLNDIVAAAALKNPGLFPDYLESSLYAQARKIVRDAEGRIIRNGVYIIFGVEPENDVRHSLGSTEIHK